MKWIYEFRWPILIFAGVLAFLFFVVAPVGGGCIKSAAQSEVCSKVHVIGIALYSYANDHQGRYPKGTYSTEVFQQLVDEKYIDDPGCFFVNLPGKVPWKDLKLKPENVGFDFTGGADAGSSPNLPLVYMTGYRVTYAPGAFAIPIAPVSRTLVEYLLGGPELGGIFPICRINMDARVLRADKDGSIPNFILVDLEAQGKTYRQLTP